MEPTTKAHKFVCEEAKKFVIEKWKDINKERVEIKSKEKILDEISKDVYVALWIFTEVAQWGMKSGKIEYYVETPKDTDFFVLKINDKYIKFKESGYPKYDLLFVEFTEPKIKLVEVKYFE
jgi:hypothetical protein